MSLEKIILTGVWFRLKLLFFPGIIIEEEPWMYVFGKMYKNSSKYFGILNLNIQFRTILR